MKVKKYLYYIISALILALFIRNFVLEFYYILPSDKNLKSGVLSVNKLKYGGRFPITAISLPFFADKLPFTNIRSYLDVRFPYFRFFGFSDISQDDEILFNTIKESNLAIDRRSINLAKCVAINGDTLSFSENKLFVNNEKKYKLFSEKYRIWISDEQSNFRDNNSLESKNLANFIGAFKFSDRDEIFKDLQNDTSIQAFQIKKRKPSFISLSNKSVDEQLFIIVPKKDESVKLNSQNFHFLLPILIEHEGVNVKIEKKKLYIDGRQTQTYTFTQDYFLILLNSAKGFEFQFIPESHIIGIVN